MFRPAAHRLLLTLTPQLRGPLLHELFPSFPGPRAHGSCAALWPGRASGCGICSWGHLDAAPLLSGHQREGSCLQEGAAQSKSQGGKCTA